MLDLPLSLTHIRVADIKESPPSKIDSQISQPRIVYTMSAAVMNYHETSVCCISNNHETSLIK